MKKFDYWDIRFKLDDLYYGLTNIILKTVHGIKSLQGKNDFLQKNSILKDIHKDKKVFIIGNGPSVNRQDLKLLKDEICISVNRGYKHRDYEIIKPEYHVIVDPKLANGVWDIKMLDEIHDKNSNVTFLLNSKWFNIDKFKPYKKNTEFKIFWVNSSLFFTPFYTKRSIDFTTITYGNAVLGKAIMSAIYMGSNQIYLLGVESTGLCHEVLNENSHFYGVNEDNSLKNFVNTYQDFYFMHLHLKYLHMISNFAKLKNIKIINITPGGILNMFERKDFESLFENKSSN